MDAAFEPGAPIEAVAEPEVTKLFSTETLEVLDAVRFLETLTWQDAIILRSELWNLAREGSPRFLCDTCGVVVQLRSSVDRRHFFRHDADPRSCAQTEPARLSKDEILARKFHGMVEGPDHKRVKRLLLESLRADTAFSEVLSERNWRSSTDMDAYRRPDVRANRGVEKFAFEVQLATTFLHVILERTEFYQAERAILVWILKGFDPAQVPMSIRDVMVGSSLNAFVVNEETARISVESGQFTLECWYPEPIAHEGNVRHEWRSCLAPFSELKTDASRNRFFFFDHEKKMLDVLAEQERTLRVKLTCHWQNFRGTRRQSSASQVPTLPSIAASKREGFGLQRTKTATARFVGCLSRS